MGGFACLRRAEEGGIEVASGGGYMELKRSHVAALSALSELQRRNMERIGIGIGTWFGDVTARLIADHHRFISPWRAARRP